MKIRCAAIAVVASVVFGGVAATADASVYGSVAAYSSSVSCKSSPNLGFASVGVNSPTILRLGRLLSSACGVVCGSLQAHGFGAGRREHRPPCRHHRRVRLFHESNRMELRFEPSSAERHVRRPVARLLGRRVREHRRRRRLLLQSLHALSRRSIVGSDARAASDPVRAPTGTRTLTTRRRTPASAGVLEVELGGLEPPTS